MKDGWHRLQGKDVYVENGKISRGCKHDYTPAYIYRWNKQYRAYIREYNVTPAAFVAGLRRGTIALM